MNIINIIIKLLNKIIPKIILGKTDRDLSLKKRDLDLLIKKLQSLHKTLSVKQKVLEETGRVKERVWQVVINYYTSTFIFSHII